MNVHQNGSYDTINASVGVSYGVSKHIILRAKRIGEREYDDILKVSGRWSVTLRMCNTPFAHTVSRHYKHGVSGVSRA